jgi:hypothetical protein
VFWSAVVATVAFAGCAEVSGLLYWVARRERDVADSSTYVGEIGGGKNIEGEVEWGERCGRFDTRSVGDGRVGI